MSCNAAARGSEKRRRSCPFGGGHASAGCCSVWVRVLVVLGAKLRSFAAENQDALRARNPGRVWLIAQLQPALPSALATGAPGTRHLGPLTRPKKGRGVTRRGAAPKPPPMASPPKQRRFFQRPVNANAPQDYTPFAAPPPPPGSARRFGTARHRLLAERDADAHGLGLLAAPSARFSADERATTPTAAVSVRSRKCRVEKEGRQAERSAVQDERLLRQRASEDAEALQNEVKELRRRCSLENEERQRAAEEAERLSKELTERGEATLQEVATLNTKLAQAERKVKVRTENEDDDPLRPGSIAARRNGSRRCI